MVTAHGGEDFEAFYQAAYPALVADLYTLTGDWAAAQDVAQESFVRAWVRWSRVGRYDNPAAWVHHVGRRLAVSRWRRAATAAAALVRHGAPSSMEEPGPDRVALVRALRRLPERQRQALVLHHMAGLTVAEIAADAGVAEGTVKSWLSRGRQALAAELVDPSKQVFSEDVFCND